MKTGSFLQVTTLVCKVAFVWIVATELGYSQVSSNVNVKATGFNSPRGLKFGPDGFLYVAEGGTGGTASTAGVCDQVVPPIGPYTGGFTGRISKVDQTGTRQTVVDNLPSSQTSAGSGGLVSGVADVAFVGSTLYALIAGAGCSHGLAGTPNGVMQIDTVAGTATPFADLSTFVQSNPVANPSSDDFEPDGTFYSLVSLGNKLFTVEPNHGEIDEIDSNGTIKRVVDISESHGHIVPTALVYHNGWFFGNLFLFPTLQGSSNVFAYSNKRIRVVVPQLTTVVGLAFDQRERLYILEMSPATGGPTPGNGKIVRYEYNGQLTDIATGLSFPTAMTFGPDGLLYVSHKGFGFPPGTGEIVTVTITN
jgi:hypothetical protein